MQRFGRRRWLVVAGAGLALGMGIAAAAKLLDNGGRPAGEAAGAVVEAAAEQPVIATETRTAATLASSPAPATTAPVSSTATPVPPVPTPGATVSVAVSQQQAQATATQPPAAVTPPRTTGIVEAGGGPFSSAFFQASNRWQGEVNGVFTQVWAGHNPAGPAQGAVLAGTTAADLTPAFSGRIPTPRKAGAVRIVAVDGQRFTLRAADGSIFTFDLAARAFVP